MKFSHALKSALSAAALGFLALGLTSTPAFATTTGSTFGVSATVQTNCTITNAATLVFGTYTGIALKVPSGGITVNCTNGTPYTIGLDLGLNGGNGNTRYMINSSNKLGYQLFSDNLYSVAWGSTTGLVSSTGTGLDQLPFIVYGTIPAGEAVVTGAYLDTIGVTVTY
jgi:spore coat protein U-like protein